MAKNECLYNSGVNCPENGRCCQTCGWDPNVAALRRNRKPKVRELPNQQPLRRKGGHPRRVAKINEAGDVLECYPSLVMAAAVNGINPTSVKYHCQGVLRNPFKCTGGYSFRYAD